MNLQDSINTAKTIHGNLKPVDDFEENDYYSERFDCGFKLKQIDGQYILYLLLENLPGKDTVCIKWNGTKEDYEYMLCCIEDYTIIDFISLFLSINKLINNIGE